MAFFNKSTANDGQSAPIPFNCISPVGTESAYVSEAFRQLHISGDGEFTRKCQAVLEQSLGVGKALLTTSCTHALELAALLLNIQEGDEVIVPAFTFPSVANAFVLRGAKPIFCDVRPDTLNLDERKLPELLSSRTRVIILVHYAGISSEMDTILRLAQEGGVEVVEDNAHGLFGKYKGRALGSFGALATLSFHETKNFSCGEGGALLVNRLDLLQRAEIIREKGTNRKQFFRGQVDKYTWVDVGSSYLPSDILAAVLYAQLEVRDQIQGKRKVIWKRYAERLQNWGASAGVGLPFVPPECEQAYHLFYLVLPNLEQRTAFIHHLAGRNILSVFHYMPLHLSAMGLHFGGYAGQCPVAESVSDRLVRLPLYSSLTEAEQERVIEAILSFRTDHASARQPERLVTSGL